MLTATRAPPGIARIFTGFVVVYAFSPIDLIPDFIPVLGYLDDLVIVPLGVLLALKMIPTQVMAECRVKAEQTVGRDEGKPQYRWMAVLIVAVWIMVLLAVGYWLFRLWNK